MTDLTKHKLEYQPENPYDEANLISKVFFCWLNPFIKKGFKKDLELIDLYKVPAEDLSEDLGQTLRREWDKELRYHREGKRVSFGRALCRAFGFWYMLSGIWVTLGECIIRPLQAISLGWLIRDVNAYLALDATNPGQAQQLNDIYYQVFYDGLLLIFFSTIALITVHPYVFCTQHTGMKVRIACCHLIYRHSLKLSNAAIGQTTVGQMVNLLSNDVNRFDVALNYIQYLVIAPLQAVIAVFVLSYLYLGFYSTAAGSALLLLYVPFQSLMGRWFGRLRQATATRTDERIRLMNEIIPAMRVIKMYTWEDPFAALVELARKNEVRLIRYTSVLRGVNMALFFVSSKVILFICFITFVLLGYTLEPEVVFVSITLFNNVRLFMTLFFPYGVAQLAETLVSCNRLQEFLLLPQQESSHRVDRGQPDAPRPKRDEILVQCDNISANWTIINRTLPGQDSAPPKGDLEINGGGLGGGGGGKHDQDNPKVHLLHGSVNDLSHSMQRLSSSQNLRLDASKHSLFASSANVHLSANRRVQSILTTDAMGANHTAIAALRNIDYKLTAGELMIIVGRVGSGKSSVLMSILGELPLASGRMKIRGKISYAAQEPWIFAGSVRENVLFGKPFDEKRYQEVLHACSLDKDLKLFQFGDETVVGERGVSLSGGQRARINLARAIYYDADIYLLDDPLSAVDTLVAKHIFNECICGYLKHKVVILATHQTQFIRKDITVLYLSEGNQLSCRKYSDTGNKDLQRFIGSNWDQKSDSESAAGAAKQAAGRRTSGTGASPNIKQQQQQKKRQASTLSKQSTSAPLETAGELVVDETKRPLLSAAAAAAAPQASSSSSTAEDEGLQSDGGSTSSPKEDEENEEEVDVDAEGRPLKPATAEKLLGEAPMKQQIESTSNESVGCTIYWHYIKSCQAPLLIFIIGLSNLGTQALFSGSDFWLSYWTDTEQRKAQNNGSMNYEPVTITDQLTLRENAEVYTILIASLFGLTLIRTTSFFVACMRSSINLHNRLFRSVLRAPIKFFDYNPIGILLNRVSRDMGIVDDLLPPTAFDTIEIFINVLGILLTVAVISPINALPAVVLCTLVAIIRLLYIRTVRSIKSIEGVTRSPVFSHLAASLNGLATIRAFGVESEFEHKFDHYQDVHSSAWFLFVAASRWLGCSLDWISLSYIGVVTILLTLTVGSTTGSQIGLAISSALALSGSFQWGVRQSTEMESQMTSVARIKEYSELPEEPPRHSSRPPPLEWPAAGAIEFEQVNLRYFENEEPVLRGLNFSIRAGERVGIVGRTGAGKSSIIAVLFRLTEPEGSIRIDSIDTKTIGLHELRKKLSIIPQEPILFNGPIRRNLDPFGEYHDADMWRALEHVKLAEVVRGLPGALDAELKEGGSNFSVGERQLICLARAVLRQNRIIIMDEATANVDPDTDKSIQKTISESFTNCTRLTIAHRLNTIMDSDRVLVMDAGQVKEFDEPHLLLQKPTGIFATMVKNTGKNASHLRRVALKYYERRHGASGASA